MANISDIPDRGGDDGATQLAKLRSYLKDRDTPYHYSDDVLINQLVAMSPTAAWQLFKGIPSNGAPFSFDTLSPIIFRLRLEVGDTNELELNSTDYELCKYLEVYPLKYLAFLLKAQGTPDTKTLPSDPYNPVTVVRLFLDQPTDQQESQTDQEIANSLLQQKIDPFAYVINLYDRDLGIESMNSLGGLDLASFEGITFRGAAQQKESSQYNRDNIMSYYVGSPYIEGSIYGVYDMEGNNTSYTGGDWYEL